MENEKAETKKPNIVTPTFRVSFPNVFKPKKNDLNGKDEYSIVALFPKGTDLKTLEAEAKRAVVKKWGPDSSKWPKPLKSPFRKHEEREKEGVLPAGLEEGGIFINLKSMQKPGVVDQNVQPIIEEGEFYAGCFAKASVRAYAYDQKGNRGVAFGLGNIQKVKDGDPLGGRTRPQDDFAAIEGATSSDNSDGSAEGLFS